ncbi:hypothetical protein NBZ79_07680 [Sneathiella marina]|uniref:Terminase n=1 Tax=Sneathiella marina TaxID=2950108 RepID=A0ABY4W6P4_9PROT|nr:hypothetical protein [Sneathiella marina]USG62855.1 hypothetical protein NBZ79_07680 [Sneathiella marina]
MTKFSTDAAGFAALTLCELILQQCVKNNLFTPTEGKQILKAAAERHESCAEGEDEKIALNMETAHLLRRLSSGLGPLFDPEGRPATKAKRPLQETWVKFPD